MRNECDFQPLPQDEHNLKIGNEMDNYVDNNNDASNTKLAFSDFCKWNCGIELN